MKICAIAVAALGAIATTTMASSERTLKLEMRQDNDVRETLEVSYRVDNHYKRSSINAVNHFLRDRRTSEIGNTDRRLLDLLWDISAKVGAQDRAITVIRGHGNPRRNGKNGKVILATKSLHSKGQAIDFKIDGVPVNKLRDAAVGLAAGGVGYYRDAFIHIDTGSVRHWPRPKK